MPSYTGRWGSCRRPDDGSRMSREVHVRFCERLEVKSLWPTHPYIPSSAGFLYLVAVMDEAAEGSIGSADGIADEGTRKVLSWRVSNTMEADFCIEALEEALKRFGRPEIFNTDSKNDGVGNLSAISS